MSETTKSEGIGLFPLIGLVVSSCIGTGIFALSGNLSQVAAPGSILLSWLVVGVGFLCLALSLNNLVAKRPQLGSVYAYAGEGFGPFAGFISGWGYWLSAWLGNVAFATILSSTLGYFFPYFLPGNNIGSIIFASCINWVLVLLVIRGVESASFLNALIMVVKVASLSVFILFSIMLFNFGVFTADFWGNVYNHTVEMAQSTDMVALGDIPTQIQNCLMSLMWVFVGVEGASVVVSRAKKREQAGTATVLGLIIVVVIYVLASVVPLGYMSYTDVAALDYPAMLYIFEAMAPGWGGTFICVAMLISGFGCWLSFTLLPAEITKEMAHDKLLGSWWAKLNSHGAPTISLFAVGICTQLFMISLLFSEDAYSFAYSMCAVAIAITWALAAAFQLKLGIQMKEPLQAFIGLLATVFLVFGTVIGGWQYLLLCCLGYVPGILFYAQGRREASEKIFEGKDHVVAAIVLISAAAAVYLLITGGITI